MTSASHILSVRMDLTIHSCAELFTAQITRETLYNESHNHYFMLHHYLTARINRKEHHHQQQEREAEGRDRKRREPREKQ